MSRDSKIPCLDNVPGWTLVQEDLSLRPPRLFPFIQSNHLLVATTLPVEHGNVFDRTVLKFIILF